MGAWLSQEMDGMTRNLKALRVLNCFPPGLLQPRPFITRPTRNVRSRSDSGGVQSIINNHRRNNNWCDCLEIFRVFVYLKEIHTFANTHELKSLLMKLSRPGWPRTQVISILVITIPGSITAKTNLRKWTKLNVIGVRNVLWHNQSSSIIEKRAHRICSTGQKCDMMMMMYLQIHCINTTE